MSFSESSDSGFEVGLFGFDVAAFGADLTVPGLEVRDGVGNVLWSVGSTTISGSTHNDFDFANGLFANSLTIDINLTGLGGASDNIGFDNVHFGQVAIPEPSTLALLIGSSIIALTTRRRRIS